MISFVKYLKEDIKGMMLNLKRIDFSLIAVLLFSGLALSVISCAKTVTLTDEPDDTPPELTITVNGNLLTPRVEDNVYIMHLSDIVRLQAHALDEESGVQYVTVGTNLRVICGGTEKEFKYHASGNKPNWHPSAATTGEEVNKRLTSTYNFRLVYLQERCGKEQLTRAEGEVFAHSRNYFGLENTERKDIVLIPSNVK